nr:MFS transporter [Actinopolymorpha rutila]
MSTTVWILVLARAVNRLGAFTMPFLALTLVQDFDASVSESGYLLAAFGLATIPSRLFGGHLADSIGGKGTILIGLTGTATAQLCIAGSQTLSQATVAVVALGLMFEVYEPPSQSIIADVTSADQRPMAYGLFAAAMAAAGMGAGLLAALLASVDLRWLFVADSATCLVCAGVVAALLPRLRRERTRHAMKVKAWADRRLLSMLALGTVFAVIYLQVTIALPLTLTERGYSTSLVGVLFTLSATTMVLGRPLLARPRMRSLDDFHAMAVGYTILAGGLLLNGFATSMLGFGIATVIWSIGDLMLLGRVYTIVASIAPETGRGQYLAVYGISWGLAAVAAPLLGTQLLEHGGPRLAWTTLAALSLGLASAQPALRTRFRSPKAGLLRDSWYLS